MPETTPFTLLLVALQFFSISDQLSFPREYNSLFNLRCSIFTVSLLSAQPLEKGNDTLGNDTLSEMGKHCNAAD